MMTKVKGCREKSENAQMLLSHLARTFCFD
jgi:hypothetical protein